MCGIAGFVRHPRGRKFAQSKAIVSELLLAIEHRGKHATGVAGVTDEHASLRKWAVKAGDIVGSKVWADTMNTFGRDTRALIGHVRHATLPNAKDDRAAHPFILNRVCGAHNGVISNWRDFQGAAGDDGRDWVTDSQAALYLLDQFEDPTEALEMLEGSYALVWSKGGLFHIARNDKRPMACAYVAALRTMFWCSERKVLAAVLTRHDFDFEIWETRTETVYSFAPEKFDGRGTHNSKARYRKPKPKKRRAEQIEIIPPAPVRSYSGGKGFALVDYLRAVERKLDDVVAEVERLSAENDHLYSIIVEAGLVDPLVAEETCAACGLPEDDDEFLATGEGPIHSRCIFPS